MLPATTSSSANPVKVPEAQREVVPSQITRVACCICYAEMSGPSNAPLVSHGICPACEPAYRVANGLPARVAA